MNVFVGQIFDLCEMDSSLSASGGLESNVVSYDELAANSFGFDFPTKHNRIEEVVERGECTMDDIASDATGFCVFFFLRFFFSAFSFRNSSHHTRPCHGVSRFLSLFWVLFDSFSFFLSFFFFFG
jgi:hypothetical protein